MQDLPRCRMPTGTPRVKATAVQLNACRLTRRGSRLWPGLQVPKAGERPVFSWICVWEAQGRRPACRSRKPDADHRRGGCSGAQGPGRAGPTLGASVVPGATTCRPGPG